MKRTSLMMSALVMVIASSMGFVANSHDHELCEGFVPQNTMKIPVGVKYKWSTEPGKNGGLTEAQFNSVIDRAEKLFAEDVTKAGGTLKVNRRWSDSTVNASAQQFGTSWVVNMYGGLARHQAVTEEGFALVVCHELGHHIGGAPKINGWFGDDWATNEGGSDYYATLKCLRRFFAEDDNKAIVEKRASEIEPHARAICEKQHTTDENRLLCLRNSLAGQSVAYLFQQLNKSKTLPKYDTPDKTVVNQMDDNHPDTQCRMDTYLAGAVCPVDVTVPISNSDFREGSCVQGKNENGWRPLCWFKPSEPAPTPSPSPSPSPAPTPVGVEDEVVVPTYF